MPRGDRTGNNGSISDSNISATPKELSAFSRYALDIYRQAPPDLHDVEQVNETIINYFNSCEKNGVRPSNLGLYACLGMTRQDVDNVLTGKSRSKASPAVIDVLKRVKLSLSAYREALVMAGKVNPVTAIFWAKNYDHMTDTQTIEVTTDRDSTPLLTQSDIDKRIPLYSDSETEADN